MDKEFIEKRIASITAKAKPYVAPPSGCVSWADSCALRIASVYFVPWVSFACLTYSSFHAWLLVLVLIISFDKKLGLNIPHYDVRKWIKPGLSGWAQVNYPYTSSVEDSEKKLSYDLFYLRNFSFWLDLLIMLKTIKMVLHIKGSSPRK